ncbi:MAG: CRISPR-associated protein Cas4 [Nitrospirae bacterium]|nr:CRISPR-associated protein Cas4 [Nitrospirota bacterium]
MNIGSLTDNESTPMITPSEVIEHLYCPRFTYFMNCLNIPQHEELRYKVRKGRDLHQKRESSNRDYLRKRLGCIDKEISVYIASRELGVRGVIDEVLHLPDGSLAPLDYKYTEFREHTFETHKVQSVLYALLIMENYRKPVSKGFICYAKNGDTVKELAYSDSDFDYAKKLVKEIFTIILKGYYPRKIKWYNRCTDCCYKNICA